MQLYVVIGVLWRKNFYTNVFNNFQVFPQLNYMSVRVFHIYPNSGMKVAVFFLHSESVSGHSNFPADLCGS